MDSCREREGERPGTSSHRPSPRLSPPAPALAVVGSNLTETVYSQWDVPVMGLILAAFLAMIVMGGVAIVNLAAPIFLAIVIISLVMIATGIIMSVSFALPFVLV